MRNVWIAVAGLVFLSGCGPAPLTERDLGKIVYSFNAIPHYEEAMQGPTIPVPRSSPPNGGSIEADSRAR